MLVVLSHYAEFECCYAERRLCCVAIKSIMPRIYFFILNVVMLIVVLETCCYAEFYVVCDYAKYFYAGCPNTECWMLIVVMLSAIIIIMLDAVMLSIACWMSLCWVPLLSCCMPLCSVLNADCRYAECHYYHAVCRYAEYCMLNVVILNAIMLIFTMIIFNSLSNVILGILMLILVILIYL